jgi:hypothetical protein
VRYLELLRSANDFLPESDGAPIEDLNDLLQDHVVDDRIPVDHVWQQAEKRDRESLPQLNEAHRRFLLVVTPTQHATSLRVDTLNLYKVEGLKIIEKSQSHG